MRNVTFLTTRNGLNLKIVLMFKVRDKQTPVPFVLYDLDFGKLVHIEFLVFRRMGIIKSPLFERDMSADEVD